MNIPAPTKGHKIFCVPPHDVLRSVPTFRGGFEDFILKSKSMLFIADIGIDLSRISLNVYKYNFDLDAILPLASQSVSLPESTPLLGAWACAAFVDVANKTEITCEKVVNEKEKAILKERVKEMVELLWGIEFPSQGFKLDCQHAPPMVAEVVDAIGQKYGKLSMRAKTKFHAEQLKVEIAYLKMLTSYSCRRINEIESELKYIQGLEKIRVKEANILKAVRKQQWLIYHDFRDCLGALDQLVVVDESDTNDDTIAE